MEAAKADWDRAVSDVLRTEVDRILAETGHPGPPGRGPGLGAGRGT
ncbi:MAG: hypothetical protein MZV70_35155 [Desulfobacterales bacterium]|nr:hypothetical protein [Desulfobacterales bacterium]